MSDSEEKKSRKLNLAIDELRFKYQRVERNDTTIETKAASFLAFTAVLVTILIFALDSIFSSFETLNILHLPIALITLLYLTISFYAFILIATGVFYLLKVLNVREFTFPFTSDPNKMSEIIDMSCSDFENYLIDDYKKTIPHFDCITKKKVANLKKAMIWLKRGIIVSFILLVSILYLKMLGVLIG